jgi:hypothetical protein
LHTKKPKFFDGSCCHDYSRGFIAKNLQASSGVYMRILAEKRWIFGAVAHLPAKNRLFTPFF